jgi:nucleotidyltransferase/DNA polymerase involved in DNA repair
MVSSLFTKDDLPRILLGLELQDIDGIGKRMEKRLHRAGIFTVAQLWNATLFQLRRVWGGVNGLLFHQMMHGVDIQPPASRFSKSIGHQQHARAGIAQSQGRTSIRTASLDQGRRAAASRRLSLPPARHSSVSRVSRRLVG